MRIRRKKLFVAIFLILTTCFSTAALATEQGYVSFGNSQKEDIQAPTQEIPKTEEDIVYNIPPYVYSVNCIPGTDFLKKDDTTIDEFKSEVDSIINYCIENKLNTITINPIKNGKAIYNSNILPKIDMGKNDDGTSFDPLLYLRKICKEQYICLNIDFDSSVYFDGKGDGKKVQIYDDDTLQYLVEEIKEIGRVLTPDSITICNYSMSDTPEHYSMYRAANDGRTYYDWLRSRSGYILKTLVYEGQSFSKNTRFGLKTNEIWSYGSDNGGIDLTGDHVATYTGQYYDPITLANDGYFNFLTIDTTGSLNSGSYPFEKIIQWWNEKIINTKCAMYFTVDNSKVGNAEDGWNKPDQITRMIVKGKDYGKFTGACFTSYTSLTENRIGSTAILKKYMDGAIDDLSKLFQDLVFFSPKSTSFTTYEDRILFYGKCDPNFEILVNGKAAVTNKEGEFFSEIELKPGTNVITFENKGTTVVYRIMRKVQLINDVSPSGAITAMGGSKISIVVNAYRGSTLTASLPKCASVTLTEDKSQQSTDDQSVYTTYSGTIQLPAGTTSNQNLGKISVIAKHNELGMSESRAGGSVTILKTPEIIEPGVPGGDGEDVGGGTMIVVTRDNARVYPKNTLDIFSSPDLYNLPVGTVDYIVSGPLNYTYGGVRHTYYILKSGIRIEDNSFSTSSGSNTTNGMSVDSVKSTGNYTEVTISTAWKVPFTCKYSPINYYSKGGDDFYVDSFGANQFTVSFAYTGSGAGNMDCSASPLLSSAGWSLETEDGVRRAKLTFNLSSSGEFYGMKAYYSGDKLVLRFNNTPGITPAGNAYGYNLNGLRIVIDSGHSEGEGAINGSIGAREKIINQGITDKTASILRSLGAQVTISSPVHIDNKRAEAQRIQPHIYIAVHQNAGSSTARGGEAYYYNPFSMELAKSITGEIATVHPHGVNRGPKQANFAVTCDSGYAAILVEYGFISNASEGRFLMQDSTQEAMAQATVRGIIKYLK